MADITKTKGTLQITTSFVDGSTDLLLIDNPKASLADADIDSLNSYIADNQIIFNDDGAAFNGIVDARIVGKETTTLDIGQGA